MLKGHKTLAFTPKTIKKYLDQYIIGQEEAKIDMASIGFLHYVRQQRALGTIDQIKHTHVLLLGPTGSGKTYIVAKLAECLDLPFLSISALDIVREGFSGTSLIGRLEAFLKNHASHPNKENIIVFIDEIDKLGRVCHTTQSEDHNYDIQATLLKLVEGSIISDHCLTKTDNMLFVFAGAFTAIPELRRADHLKMGFIHKQYLIDKSAISEEIIKCGIMPELVGRMGHVLELTELTKDNLREILLSAKDSILKSYEKLFAFLNKKLVLTEADIEDIITNAIKQKTGARSLNSELERRVLKIVGTLEFDGGLDEEEKKE